MYVLHLWPSPRALFRAQPQNHGFCQSISQNHKNPDTWQSIKEKYAEKIQKKLNE